MPLKILFVSSEIFPFAKTGGLADVSCALPKTIKEAGHDIRLFMPRYASVSETKFVVRNVLRLRNLKIPLGGQDVIVHIKSSFVPESKVQIYFLDYPSFFQREGLYVDPGTGKDFPDNAERFIVFCRTTFEMLKRLHWQPDIIHCNDWQTALIPVFLKNLFHTDDFFSGIKTILTIHNVAFQGNFPKEKFSLTGLPEKLIAVDGPLEYFDQVSFLKGGIQFADLVTTVSPTYAQEIQFDEEISCGFSGILKNRGNRLVGILNGVDYSDWNPKTDPYLPENYDVHSFHKKKRNKIKLLQTFGLPSEPDYPVIGSVSRLTEQKGFDLLLEVLESLLDLPLRLVFLGKGDETIENALRKAHERFPDKIGVVFDFDDPLAHLIEGGADMFLMPSRYEPCGLNQMYSLKYGTIPIVRATGGLADTVIDYESFPEKATGFAFKEYSGKALVEKTQLALNVFQERKTWMSLVRRSMKADFSWRKSSRSYMKLYKSLGQQRK